MAAFLIKDTNPQYGGQCYFVGTRKIRDPPGRDCEAADFGDKANAKKFASKQHAADVVKNLNKMAGRTQFVLEEQNIYAQQYGFRRQAPQPTNGFTGFGHLPDPHDKPQHGGFRFVEEEPSAGGGYNGF